ncbi:uncharacterized protein LOC123504921 [Portunus trituberculatus]|uniref:uncharacterized protein LOC123504921 n=1 Tax=Portunus trituberculatus TaxID=210409 RepID=UPI001E1CDF01|nr:uncharacterized protein LOC123504921 [Portunus trituberculatus]
MFLYNDSLAFHPFSHMMAESPLLGLGSGHLLDRWMEMSEPWSSGSDLPLFSRRETPCCPHACTQHTPQRSGRQHFIILPSLFTHRARSDRKDGGRESDNGTTGPEQCQGKDAGSREQTPSATGGSKDVADSSRESEGKANGKCPWQFSVDVKGCDEVRATTEGGMLMVEGRGSSDTSRQMVRYITSLPRHVSHDSLTASLSNGRLTVTQKAAGQLQGQARTLPIDVQQKTSPQPEPEQQQQQQQQNQHQASSEPEQ